jgi:hypothetical protein
LEKDTIKRTRCADAAVSRIDSGEHWGGRKLEQVLKLGHQQTDISNSQADDLFTSKSTPAHHADTQLLRSGNVRFSRLQTFRVVNGTRLEGSEANAVLQTTGARRLSGERPLVLDV